MGRHKPTPRFIPDYDKQARESKQRASEFFLANKHFLNPAVIKQAIKAMTPEKQLEFTSLLARYEEVRQRDECHLDFLQFVRTMWPDFHGGRHFEILADVFHRIDQGEPVRTIINIAPRRAKSKFVSWLFPAWYLGKHPEKSFIQVSNITSLAEKFGSEVRDLLTLPEYQQVFPATKLLGHQKAKGRWRTTKGGEYYAAGIGAKIMGRGADVFILDDPHSEQDITTGGDVNALPSRNSFDNAYNWFTSILPRVERGGAILIVMQRLSPYDITGRLIEAMKSGQTADKWEIISIPALELDPTDPEGIKWRSTWDYWSTESMLHLRASMPPWKWSAQYQQDPSHDHSSAIKRSYWKRWALNADGTVDEEKHKNPPKCDYVIQSWDLASTTKTRSNYSACTTWGVFRVGYDDNDKPVYNIILIDAIRGKWEYPELKKKVSEKYRDYSPDCCLVEKTSVGQAIIPDLQRAGIPIRPYNPRGNQHGLRGDKESRIQAVSDIFYSGFVWVPMLPWVDDVIEEFAMFGTPGANDDYVDSTTQAMLRFREGGFISLPSDKQYVHREDDTGDSMPTTSYY